MYKSSVYNIDIPLQDQEKTLVYNTLSRAFAVLDQSDRKLIQNLNKGFTPIDSEFELLTDRMLLNGFIVPDDVDELKRVEEVYNTTRLDDKSLIYTIAPTLACNFGCDYCFQGADKPNGKMDADIKHASVEYIQQQLNSNVSSLHIAWYGGEPLMAVGVIEELSEKFMAMCAEKNIHYSAAIVTNGFGLTKDIALILEKCKVNVVQITLDGAKEYHDQRRYLLSKKPTYDRIVKNIASWIDDIHFAINLRVNIDARNQESIFGLMDDLEAHGLSGKRLQIYFAPVEATTSGCSHMSEVTMSKSDYAWLETELARYAYQKKLSQFPFPPKFMGLCGAVKPKSLVITPTGELHKCWDTVSFSHQAVGHILSPEALESNPINQAWNNWSPFKNNSCRNCKILPTCAGACAYKFVHDSETEGEAAVLPCPSWKFNIKEKLLYSAQLQGFITTDQIPEGVVTNPLELCAFDFDVDGEDLPEKIKRTKVRSYMNSQTGKRVFQMSPL